MVATPRDKVAAMMSLPGGPGYPILAPGVAVIA
jgi:hypothetical protein